MPSQPSSSSGSGASAESIAVVERIRRCGTDFYQVLEVTKTSTDDEIKKAYRKLSLKVHPDKNTAPGADEAFKAVNRAFQCLSDKDLRANFDRYGHEDPQQALRQRRRHQQAHNFYDDQFDPNDVFNAFFGGGMHHHPAFNNGRVFQAQFGRQRQGQGGGPAGRGAAAGVSVGPGVVGLLQLLPLLAFFLYVLIPTPEPVYKLQKNAPYVLERRTSHVGVPFFVKGPEFDDKYAIGSRNRRQIEYSIEVDYKEHLETQCYYEQVRQQQMYRWGDGKKARDMEMPNCTELRRLQRAF
eukprot:TRINITY_DN39733_c0_g1_i1.p1 TRINITY_DN39733_c0_g1~~TRINITY_DN39733_c0_g1_i1.p1  ORF type:complete len:296 (+),score=55.88 TRINITY_DN39733_c0_g1_i1:206-1093(+)